MDSYQGNLYDPVSLHKYPYANANPVMNTDPTGYFSRGELSVCTNISNTLRMSTGFIRLNAVIGAISGAAIGAVDSILGGNEGSQVLKDALSGAKSCNGELNVKKAERKGTVQTKRLIQEIFVE